MSETERIEEIFKIVERLQKVLLGNGDEKSVIMRLQLFEYQLAMVRNQLEENAQKLEDLEKTRNAWRNRWMGVAAVITLFWVVATFVFVSFIK